MCNTAEREREREREREGEGEGEGAFILSDVWYQFVYSYLCDDLQRFCINVSSFIQGILYIMYILMV